MDGLNTMSSNDSSNIGTVQYIIYTKMFKKPTILLSIFLYMNKNITLAHWYVSIPQLANRFRGLFIHEMVWLIDHVQQSFEKNSA